MSGGVDQHAAASDLHVASVAGCVVELYDAVRSLQAHGAPTLVRDAQHRQRAAIAAMAALRAVTSTLYSLRALEELHP